MKQRIVTDARLAAFRENLLREEKSSVTVEKYLRDAALFAAFAAGRTVTKELTVAYKQSLQAKGYAVRSINSMLASLNSLLTFSVGGIAACVCCAASSKSIPQRRRS